MKSTNVHGKFPTVFLQQITNDDTTLFAGILSNHPHRPGECLLDNRDTQLLIKVFGLDFAQ